MCSTDGYCCAFDTKRSLGTWASLSLPEAAFTHSEHNAVFLDNFFTSHDLLSTFRPNEFWATQKVSSSNEETKRKLLQLLWPGRGGALCKMEKQQYWADGFCKIVVTCGTTEGGHSTAKTLEAITVEWMVLNYQTKPWTTTELDFVANIAVVHAWRIQRITADERLDPLAFVTSSVACRYWPTMLNWSQTSKIICIRYQLWQTEDMPDIVCDREGHIPHKLEKATAVSASS